MAMGPNHTVGDTVIWIASERVLFAGNLAMRAQPAFASLIPALGSCRGDQGGLRRGALSGAPTLRTIVIVSCHMRTRVAA
jgi:hypothetical protein